MNRARAWVGYQSSTVQRKTGARGESATETSDRAEDVKGPVQVPKADARRSRVGAGWSVGVGKESSLGEWAAALWPWPAQAGPEPPTARGEDRHSHARAPRTHPLRIRQPGERRDLKRAQAPMVKAVRRLVCSTPRVVHGAHRWISGRPAIEVVDRLAARRHRAAADVNGAKVQGAKRASVQRRDGCPGTFVKCNDRSRETR